MRVGKLLDLCLFVTERLHTLVVAVLLATAVKLLLAGLAPAPAGVVQAQPADHSRPVLARLPLP